MPAIDAVLARIDADLDASLERLFAFLRIPSISTDPAYRADCESAARSAAEDLTAMGFEASVRPTSGQPMVVGHYTGAGPDKPHVLFYGHYDVQPVDPLELWTSPPFEPRIVTRPDGIKVIVARGAEDDKGQLRTFFEACRAFRAETGGLPVNVTVFLEGEEESGSPSLVPFLAANRAELAHDVALVCDTSMWDRRTPAITTMLRGLVGEEITITAANRDLHSGAYGSAARNPNHVLAAILAALHDDKGAVTVPGFYDGVRDVPAEILAEWKQIDFSEAAFLGDIGLSIPAGEAGRSVLEMIWTRPTCEVNGMTGGYTGAGFKTVIPSKASAKVSFRLVAGQDPERLREALRAFVRERVPADCTAEFTPHVGSPAVAVPFDSAFLDAGRAGLTDEWGKPAVRVAAGGSIPVVGYFKEVLGIDSLLIGFGLDDDQIHSPNEKYDLDSFHKGTRAWARILAKFGEMTL
jgi:acetylornithine deacetylase/succinyl-diaminopimelate desuccinylase-like protein